MNLDNIKSIDNRIKNIPEFYQNVISSWISIGGSQIRLPKTPIEIAKQNIWGNKYIKHNNKVHIF